MLRPLNLHVPRHPVLRPDLHVRLLRHQLSLIINGPHEDYGHARRRGGFFEDGRTTATTEVGSQSHARAGTVFPASGLLQRGFVVEEEAGAWHWDEGRVGATGCFLAVATVASDLRDQKCLVDRWSVGAYHGARLSSEAVSDVST